MSTRPVFPNLAEAARRIGTRKDLSQVEFRELLCRDCDFFHEDHEDDLECSCFRMLRVIIERGVMSPQQLAAALDAIEKDDTK